MTDPAPTDAAPANELLATSNKEHPAAGTHRECTECDDDGYVEVWDDEGGQIVDTHECPLLDEPWHAPFNATGILG